MRLPLSVLLGAVTIFAHASDCVPLAFAHLSAEIGAPVSYEVWAHSLAVNDHHSPCLEDSLNAWRSRLPDHPLVCVYSAVPAQDLLVVPLPPLTDTPYLWIGYARDDMIDRSERDDADCHACVAYFTDDGARLIHQLGAAKNHATYTETLTWAAFFERTLFVLATH